MVLLDDLELAEKREKEVLEGKKLRDEKVEELDLEEVKEALYVLEE